MNVCSVADLNLQDLGFFVFVFYTDALKTAYRFLQHLLGYKLGNKPSLDIAYFISSVPSFIRRWEITRL